MAKVSEEGINIRALVDGIRTKVNDTNPTDRQKYVQALGSYLEVPGRSTDELAPRIKPALERADSKKLIDIATTIGIKPSGYMSFNEPKSRINITNPRDPNDIISANRNPLQDSVTDPEMRRRAVMKAQEKVKGEDIDSMAEVVARKLEGGKKDAGKVYDKFIGEGKLKDGFGIQFLNNLFKKQEPVKTPVQQHTEDLDNEAENALQKGLDPEFVKGYVDDNLRDKALQVLLDNDEQISDANVQYVVEQLKASKKK